MPMQGGVRGPVLRVGGWVGDSACMHGWVAVTWLNIRIPSSTKVLWESTIRTDPMSKLGAKIIIGIVLPTAIGARSPQAECSAALWRLSQQQQDTRWWWFVAVAVAAGREARPQQEEPGGRPQVLLPFPHGCLGDVFKRVHGDSCAFAWLCGMVWSGALHGWAGWERKTGSVD